MSSSTAPQSKLIFAPGAQTTSSSSDQALPQQAAQFKVGTLSRSDLDSDPLVQFHKWFSDPRLEGIVPETTTLSTTTLPSGRVSSRLVYLKELDPRGFVIYTNLGTSRKASDLSSSRSPFASLTFWWKPLERQVRIEGPTERLTPAESQIYFDTRARGSRIGAWASQQSSVLNPYPRSSSDDGRAELESQVAAVESKFADIDFIPVPPFWGGLRIIPDMIEFWQGRESRLHDRFRFTRTLRINEDECGKAIVEKGGHGEWHVDRLSP